MQVGYESGEVVSFNTRARQAEGAPSCKLLRNARVFRSDASTVADRWNTHIPQTHEKSA